MRQKGLPRVMEKGLELELNLFDRMMLGLLCGSVREVKIFHLLALGSPSDAQGLWNGDVKGSMAVGRVILKDEISSCSISLYYNRGLNSSLGFSCLRDKNACKS